MPSFVPTSVLEVKLTGSGMQVWGWLLLSGQSVLMSLSVTKHWHRMPRESGTGVRCWSVLLGDGQKTPGDGLGHPALGGLMEQGWTRQTQRLPPTSAILSITVTINGAVLGACSAWGVKAVTKATPQLTGSSSMSPEVFYTAAYVEVPAPTMRPCSSLQEALGEWGSGPTCGHSSRSSPLPPQLLF